MSFVASANGHDQFPIENLPLGIFSHAPSGRDARVGVAIGDSVLDLRAASAKGLLDGLGFAAERVLGGAALNAFMALTRTEWRATRSRVRELLAAGSAREAEASECLVARRECAMHLPAAVGDYTDFYSSKEHATNVGTMFRGAANALQPNWLRMPIGYHGRASSVVPSGTPVTRPKGQLQVDKADASKGAAHGACRLLDFELEVAFFVGGPPNALGAPLDAAAASERIFGFVLCNDWSARDVQKFEYVPLGPFGAKNFATTISCWVVSPDALEPFRCATSAGTQDPPPLAYLDDPRYGSYDVALEVALKPAGAEAFAVVSKSNLRHLYWTPTQQLVHHSVTGCDMRPGDLLASGTISGAAPGAYGSLLELSWMGSRDVGPLADGSTRTFLQDGDAVRLAATCRGATYSLGFGDCVGAVLPADAVAPPPPPPAPPLRSVALHGYWRSSSAWRVRVALGFYGIRYETVAVPLLEGKQAALSAMGQVPRLDWTDAGGVRRSLTQSLAIIEFLDSVARAPAEPSLFPADALDRARAREIAEIVNSGTQPLQNLGHLRALEGLGVDAKARVAKPAIAKGLAAVEALVVDGDRFCVGAHVSVADACLVPQLYNARRYGVDLAAYPKLAAIEARLAAHPAFVAAHASNQPDAAAP